VTGPIQESRLRDQARAVIARALADAELPCITSSFQAECVVLTHMPCWRKMLGQQLEISANQRANR
jgi:hypothetical protein